MYHLYGSPFPFLYGETVVSNYSHFYAVILDLLELIQKLEESSNGTNTSKANGDGVHRRHRASSDTTAEDKSGQVAHSYTKEQVEAVNK